jgi:hypothetical protein
MAHDRSHEALCDEEEGPEIASHYAGQKCVGAAGKVDQAEESAADKQPAKRREVTG